MAVSDVRDYLLCIEHEKAEALYIAERTAQSACGDSSLCHLHLLTCL